MKREGYRVENLPDSAAELQKSIQRRGAVFNAYAGGAKTDFLKNGNPELISAEQYAEWTSAAIRPERMAEITALDGELPGSYIATDGWHCRALMLDIAVVMTLDVTIVYCPRKRYVSNCSLSPTS